MSTQNMAKNNNKEKNTVGTIFLASIDSSPSSPPATDQLLQPSPSIRTSPHLQQRKKQASTG